jgi:AAA+ ATPase superfamily predicted ATPase
MVFHGRTRELALLDQMYAKSAARLFLLYGRRRVGKTELVKHWLQTRKYPALYWQAELFPSKIQLAQFSHAVQQHRFPRQAIPQEFSFGSWEQAFLEIARLAHDSRLVVVLDEFTYALAQEPALASILQKVWDHHLKETQVVLILSGSHAGMIARSALEYRSPLYGRATHAIHLQPLPFGFLSEFFPHSSTEDRLTYYGMLDGIPAYLELLEDGAPLEQNIRTLLSSHLIVEDAQKLLRDQFTEVVNYFSVVRAIAAGHTRMSEIGTMSAVPANSIGPYLKVLQDLGIVERQVPATESHPERSKQGHYRIRDHYLRFYFRFLSDQNLSNLSLGLYNAVIANIQKHLPEFIGTHTFEEVAREWVARMGDAGELPLMPRRVGSFWGTHQPQIDVVAINEDEHAIMLGVCKWTDEPIDKSVVTNHLARAVKVIPEPAERWRVYHLFFGKSGFTLEAKRAAAPHKCFWVDLKQLERDLRRLSQ